MSKDPFKNFKQAMDETVFRDMSFSEKQKKKILSMVRNDYKICIDIYILKALQSSDKTGFDIYKNIQTTKANEQLYGEEGDLYISLHKLELKSLIGSTWVTKEGQTKKYYYLEKKGKKLLASWEKATTKEARTSLKLHLEGGRW